ncbi:hypothetical protein TNCV_4994711 [Trichonephila clavipes]|nr:hypothetical protein TNCV_4994711 [Trichonephila clavipes]
MQVTVRFSSDQMDDRWRQRRSPPPQFRHEAEGEGNIQQSPALVIQPTRLSDPLILRTRTVVTLNLFVVSCLHSRFL